jgi:nitroreductase
VETYEAITTRRSIQRMGEGVPSRADISKLLAAAVRAPNHHLTQPWRFVVLTGDALKELGDAWASGEEAAGGDPDQVRDKPQRAPMIICAIERPHTWVHRVVEIEEHHAMGAAIENILLAAHDMGLAAMIRTGAAARMPEVHRYLGVEEGELIAGFIYVGYPPADDDHPLTRRKPVEEITEWKGFE